VNCFTCVRVSKDFSVASLRAGKVPASVARDPCRVSRRLWSLRSFMRRGISKGGPPKQRTEEHLVMGVFHFITPSNFKYLKAGISRSRNL
jgi:hypothetical protein